MMPSERRDDDRGMEGFWKARNSQKCGGRQRRPPKMLDRLCARIPKYEEILLDRYDQLAPTRALMLARAALRCISRFPEMSLPTCLRGGASRPIASIASSSGTMRTTRVAMARALGPLPGSLPPPPSAATWRTSTRLFATAQSYEYEAQVDRLMYVPYRSESAPVCSLVWSRVWSLVWSLVCNYGLTHQRTDTNAGI